MKKIMRKIMSSTIVFVVITSLTVPAFAHTVATNGMFPTYIGEKTVEVDTHEDFLNYPKDMRYKYTFIIKNPPVAQPRNSICYRCGQQSLTMSNYERKEAERKPLHCPYSEDIIDHFTTWRNTYDLSCGSCGYRETIHMPPDYTAYCLNPDYPWLFMRTITVKPEWTKAQGYEDHQCWETWQR